MRWSPAWLLYPALSVSFSHAAPAKLLHDCEVSAASADKARARLKAEHPDAPEACFQSAFERFSNCLAESAGANDCGELSSNSQGISDGADDAVKGLLQGHNCARVKEHCFEKSESEFFRMTDWNSCRAPEEPASVQIKPRALVRAADVLAEARDCNKAQAEKYEKSARETLAAAEPARADGIKRSIACGKSESDLVRRCHLMGADPSTQCIRHDNGNEVCRDAPEGTEFSQLDENDPEQMKQLQASPGRIENSKGAHCSGGTLGDGQTFISAGHCDIEGTRPVKLIDANGQIQMRNVTCSQGVYNKKSDAQVCQLDVPIEAKPAYLAVRDDSYSTCTKVGWQMRCPAADLEILANAPATMVGYPANYPLSRSTGFARYNRHNNTFEHNLAASGGSSGSNIYFDYKGDTVILGPMVRARKSEVGSGDGYVITPDDLAQMKLQSLSHAEIEAAAPLFRELDMLAPDL